MSDKIKTITLKDGTIRYRFVVDIGREELPNGGSRRKQLTKTFDRKREAVAEYNRIRHQVNTGRFVQPRKLTVGEYLDTWVVNVTRDREEGTRANYRHALRPVRERLGHKQLQALTKDDVSALVDWMASAGRVRGGKPGTGLGPRSIQLTLSRLRAALDDALEDGLVVRNAAARVKGTKLVKAKREPWSSTEVKAFVASAADDRLYAAARLSLLGLRPAEVCGLRWSSVDVDAGELLIDNTRTLVDGKVVEKGPKSDAGGRGLPLDTATVAALKATRTRQKAERLAAGEAYTGGAYVVCDELGEPVKTDWYRRRIYKLMDAAGARRVRLYDARHACLTYLANEGGVPIAVVAAWAGHSDPNVTLRTYVHTDARHLAVARDAVAELLG